MNFQISDLRERPELFEIIADRIWRAWWEPRGLPRVDFERRARESLGPDAIPSAFVAHDGDVFLGTASLIASDLDERPTLTPWVAAVWTEPEARKRGAGRALIAHARDQAFRLGYDPVYLCAHVAMRMFYLKLGWTVLEERVGPRQLTVFACHRAA